jgi:ABC-type uncharacterized transport system substrate-binding protein
MEMAMKTILALAVGDPSVSQRLVDPKAPLYGVRPYILGLIKGLQDLGYSLGGDYTIDYRHHWYDDVMSGLAFKDLGQPDLIYAMSTTVMRKAGDNTKGIPIVFANCSDHEAEPYVQKRLATGFSARRSQTAHRCFERFLATVPTLKEVHVLHKTGYDPSDLALTLVVNSKQNNHKNVELKIMQIKNHSEIEEKLSSLDARRPAEQGILVLPVDVFFGAAPTIIKLGHDRHLPTFFPVTDWVMPKPPSALGGYGIPQKKCGRRSAELVDRILWKGEGLPNLPPVIDGADHDFEWVVSSCAAEALKISLADIGAHPRII